MKLELLRFSDQNESTLCILCEDAGCCKQFLCFTLEDTYREEKIAGETRIPAGKYKIKLRTYGSHHNRYKVKFPEFHVGMLEIMNVPDFTDILIHIGNKIKDTEGCLIVGSMSATNIFNEGMLGDSTSAYMYMYQYIIRAFEREEEVEIDIIDHYRGECE